MRALARRGRAAVRAAAVLAAQWQCSQCGKWFESSTPPRKGPYGQLCGSCTY